MSILWLSREDVCQAGGGKPEAVVPAIEAALATHAAGDTCQPLKPYLRIPNDEQSRRIIAMPAYLGGEFQTWGLKWIASSPSNPSQRQMERASAISILNDVQTGRPVAMMDSTVISAARTAAVALIATKYLVRALPSRLAVIGTGVIGTMTARSLLNAHPSIDYVKLYDQQQENAVRAQRSLSQDMDRQIEFVDSPQTAMDAVDIVLVATTVQDGYIEGDWMKQGTLFLNISLRDPKYSVVQKADKLVVDDWDQCDRGNTLIHKMTQQGLLTRDDLYAELPDLITGRKPGREHDDETILFNPMGLAIEDLATAWTVYNNAKRLGLGVQLKP